jgi:hypothetical protein
MKDLLGLSALSSGVNIRLGTEEQQENVSGEKDQVAKGKKDIASIRRRIRGVAPALAPSKKNALHSDVFIPEQFFTLAHHSAGHWTGARRLLLAVLQDAFACWFRSCGARSARGRRQFQETHAWFWAQDRHWLFAFERICEQLKLDPDYIRCELTSSQTSRQSRQPACIRAEPVTPLRHLSLVRN